MIIEIDNIWKRFGRFDALEGLSFTVPEGSAFALIGANGAGKSTTMKILMNLIEASRGTAKMLGVDSRALSPREFAQIGYVSENQELPPRLTVGDYLAYLRRLYPTWDQTLEKSLLQQLELPPERKIGHLSHGMRIKMALACALAYRPRLLVLDEPFSGLDPLVRKEFMQSLMHQAGETTILISSHELGELEHTATHVAFIDRGKVAFQESMETLTSRVRKVFVTLDRPAAPPENPPREWLDIRATGNVVSFVETQFTDTGTNARVLATMGPVRNIAVEPVALTSIFTIIAGAARRERAQA
jgi:ABC-2 type transport system ATP-binding protein